MDSGASLGPYTIDRELGAGGMGKVYAATGAEGVVALKIVHPYLLETPGFFKRFMREARLGQSIRHENVVRTIDCDQEFADGKPQCFLVMEYVEGQTLSELLVELDRVPEELCRHVAREICKGLSAIHDAGVVHRDLKPDNVLITPEHVVKVMDLGVAKLSDETMKLSKSGAFVGSVEYAAPEQFKGGDVDGRTDLHALGLLLYELATGLHPFRGDSFAEVLGRVCNEAPRRLGEINPQLSAFFEEVVHTLLIKDPRGRFASATQLQGVLRDGEDSDWWASRSQTIREETQRPIRRIRIQRETAVYGRDTELSKLRRLYDEVAAGDGRVALALGEAGIGKSRLIDEFVAGLQRDGEDVNFLFGGYPPGGAATAEGGFSSAFREHFGEVGSAPHLRANQALVPAFDALLRGEGTPEGAQPLDKAAIQTCFTRATQHLAAGRPTIILIEDLHFAPDGGRNLFTALATALRGHRVLLIGTLRPGVSEEWLAELTRLEQTTQLALLRLGAKDLARLLEETLQSEFLARELGQQVAVKSDGNPFFVFEILRGLREGNFISRRDDGTWVRTGVIEDIEIPSSVLDLVAARVSGLTEEERDLLDVACCIGYEFDPGLVGEVLGMRRIPVLKRFGQIERAHRLVRSSGRKYAFDHHQVQESLYGTLHEQMREEYHGALSEALETRTGADSVDPNTLDGQLCVDLCEHGLKGSRGAAVVRYLPAAHKHLADGYVPAQEAALIERALAAPGLLAGADRARWLIRLAAVLCRLSRLDASAAAAHEAVRLARDTEDRTLLAAALRRLGDVSLARRDRDEAEESAREVLEIGVALGDKNIEGDGLGALGAASSEFGRPTEAEAYFRRALELARALGDRDREATVIGFMGVAVARIGRRVEACELWEQELAVKVDLGDRRGEATCRLNLGTALAALGRVGVAIEHTERALATFRELGDRDGEFLATNSLGNASHMLGRFAKALAWHERGLALCRETGDRASQAIAWVNLGFVLLDLGELDRAREALNTSRDDSRESRYRYPEGYALQGLGQLAAEEGAPAVSQRLWEESLALRREIGHGDGICASLIFLGEHWWRAGEDEAARSALEEAVAWASAHDESVLLARAAALLAALPGEGATAALEALDVIGETDRKPPLLWHLYRATDDSTHLAEAKRRLDDVLAENPPEYHEAMRTKVRVNREILAAWREEFREDHDSVDQGSGPESPAHTG